MKKKKRFVIFNLIMYLLCCAVLIFESCMNGKVSSSHSSGVGGAIADIVNGATGDKSEIIFPTSAKFEKEVSDVNVNDTISYKIVTTPADATYQSYIFTSSDSSVATIDDGGNVTFLKEGSVTFTATNKDHKEVTCSTSVNVNKIVATKLDVLLYSSVDGVKTYVDKDDSNTYTLTINQTYNFESIFTPENTTYTDLSFSIDDEFSSYIDITDYTIKIKKALTKPALVTVTSPDLQTSFYVNSKAIEVVYIPLQAVNISYTSYISLGQTLSFSSYVKYVPTNTSYKGFTLTSSDSSVIKVSGTSLKGLKEGSATIKATSKHDPSISFSKIIEVKKVDLVDFSIKLKSSMNFLYVDQQDSLIVSTYKPSNASYRYASSKTFTSSDPSVISISSSGAIKALKEGTSTLTLKFDDKLSKSLTVEVKSRNIIDDFTYKSNLKIDNVNDVINTNQNYTLSESLFIDKYYLNGSEVNITDKKYTIKMDESIDPDTYTLTSTTLSVNQPGKYELDLTHTTTSITKSYEFYAVDKLSLDVPEKLSVNDEVQLNLPYSDKLYYDVEITNEDVIKTTSLDKNLFSFAAINNGKATIKFIPVLTLEYETIKFDDLASVYSINVSHIIPTDYQVNLFNHDNNQSFIIALVDGQYNLSVSVGENVSLYPTIDNLATNYNFQYVSSNKNILEVKGGNIIAKTSGKCLITVTETESNVTKIINVTVTNIIKLDKEKPFTISGTALTYDEKTYTYKITNGTSGRIKVNFDDSSTYKKVSYYSTNNDVVTVGKDGILTPVGLGNSKIIITVDDGISEGVKITLSIEVVKKDLITNLSDFFYKIRKGLGHFGAFLVLGIFSSLLYLTILNDKKLLISIPLNIALGFGIAALTEGIQKLVPGRYGCFSDIMLDFTGFMCSAVLITVIYIVLFIVKLIKKHKNKEKVS